MTADELSVDRTPLERANEGRGGMGYVASADGEHDVPLLQKRINRRNDIGHPCGQMRARSDPASEIGGRDRSVIGFSGVTRRELTKEE